VELLTASSLRSRHGFPTRQGGVSKAPWDSLNCSFSVGDDAAAVRANLDALAHEAGVSSDRLLAVKQVHGDRVVSSSSATPDTEADALWTRTPGVAVGVRTADCLPILIEDRRSGAVAAVHAGWRGVISEIVARTVEALQRGGSQAEDLHVAIGPCIQRCCFEVDGDLPDRFRAAFGEEVIAPQPGKAKVHLDLPRAVAITLERWKVPAAHVVALPQCTHCDARFFSHRREHGNTGRHLSFITCAAAAAL